EANEAKEKGFIDEVLFQETKAVASSGNVIPQKVIDGVRNTLMDQKLKNEDSSEESKEDSSDGLSSKQKQEVRDIVKDEIKKQTKIRNKKKKKKNRKKIN